LVKAHRLQSSSNILLKVKAESTLHEKEMALSKVAQQEHLGLKSPDALVQVWIYIL
jgi:hypothetical protein